jgi:hypothetical protein
MRGWNWRPVGCVFVEFIPQRADRNAENIGCVRTVAEAVLERFQDQIALDFRHGAPDEVAGNLLSGDCRMSCEVCAPRLIESCTVG